MKPFEVRDECTRGACRLATRAPREACLMLSHRCIAALLARMPEGTSHTVLHYTGADDDRGGIMSVLRALATADRFTCVLGVNQGFSPRREPSLAIHELPPIEGESIGPRTMWRARSVAQAVRAWLGDDPLRVFHGHSRAGLLVALWLKRWGERRVVVSVHCYGRQRWFYRYAARQLGARLYWLSPAMKRYYGVTAAASWTQCIPGCVPEHRELLEGREVTSGDILRLGGIGMVVRWKGWHLIVDAIASLPPDVRRRLRFDHIGGTPGTDDAQQYAAELRALVAARRLNDVITWRGEQPSSAGLLREIDCLVVASHNEPFSIAVLEAWSAGVPVLAADSGGARDLIVAGTSGWFFRSGDSASLAAQIQMLVQTGGTARAAVAEERVHAFTAPVVAERWAQVYTGL
jgi:glycosyltransferase involved in cell wall biosynthesis